MVCKCWHLYLAVSLTCWRKKISILMLCLTCDYIRYLLMSCMYIVDAWTSVHTVIWPCRHIFIALNLENVLTVGIICISIFSIYLSRTVCCIRRSVAVTEIAVLLISLFAVEHDGALLFQPPTPSPSISLSESRLSVLLSHLPAPVLSMAYVCTCV